MNTFFRTLPLFARIAIERIQNDERLRSVEMLDGLLDAYAQAYGMQCLDADRAQAHTAAARFLRA